MYEVVNRFRDRDGHIYEVGDTYPAEGKKLIKRRAEELTKIHPVYKVAFLKEIKVENAEKTSKNTQNTSKNSQKSAQNSRKSGKNTSKSAENDQITEFETSDE